VKLVTAIIKTHKIGDVRVALGWFGVRGLTITESVGYGGELGHEEIYRGSRYFIDLVPNLRLDIVVADYDLVDIVNVIVNAASTGTSGDGKIWVTHVDEFVRIRTGERGPDAL
jgi:nitrogen regulatory protein P-II 1